MDVHSREERLAYTSSGERSINLESNDSHSSSRTSFSQAQDTSQLKTRDIKIKIIIVDDHVLVREGIRSLLENQPDIEILDEATNGREAIQKTIELKPDIVLMDITMPEMGGIEATIAIKEVVPETKILVLSVHEEDHYLSEILKAGASGYFIKGGSSSELISALHSVQEGHVFLYPTMTKKLVGDYLIQLNKGVNERNYNNLTPREKEILKLIAEGYSNQEIASDLFLSPATIQTHRSNIMSKLQVHSRSELTKYAISRGIITLDN